MSNYEYELFDGEYFHTLNLVNISQDKTVATIAVTCAGKISVQEFDLQENENGLYFEYGVMNDKIYINDFDNI